MTFVKAKTKDGQEVEVELPEGYGLRSQIIAETQEAFEGQVKKRLARARAETIDKTIDNPEERAKLIERLASHLPKPEGDGKGGKVTKEQLETLKQELETAHVRPLREQLQRAQTTIGQLRGASLEAQLVAAATALKVRPEFLKPLFDGGKSPLLSMLEGHFGVDEEHNTWHVKRGEHFALSAKDPTKPMGVGEFLEQLKGKPEHVGLFVDERQSGADFRQPGGAISRTDELSKLPPAERMSRAREMGLK